MINPQPGRAASANNKDEINRERSKHSKCTYSSTELSGGMIRPGIKIFLCKMFAFKKSYNKERKLLFTWIFS